MKVLRRGKYYNETPTNHKCRICGKGRNKTNFTFSDKGHTHLRPVCNICKRKIDMGEIKDSKALKEKLKPNDWERKVLIRENIAEYFKGKSYD